MLLTHLLFALFSIIITTIAIILPSKTKLLISKALAVGTLVTGTILVVVTQSSLLSACMSGIFYLIVVLSGMFVVNRRLAIKELR